MSKKTAKSYESIDSSVESNKLHDTVITKLKLLTGTLEGSDVINKFSLTPEEIHASTPSVHMVDGRRFPDREGRSMSCLEQSMWRDSAMAEPVLRTGRELLYHESRVISREDLAKKKLAIQVSGEQTIYLTTLRQFGSEHDISSVLSERDIERIEDGSFGYYGYDTLVLFREDENGNLNRITPEQTLDPEVARDSEVQDMYSFSFVNGARLRFGRTQYEDSYDGGHMRHSSRGLLNDADEGLGLISFSLYDREDDMIEIEAGIVAIELVDTKDKLKASRVIGSLATEKTSRLES